MLAQLAYGRHGLDLALDDRWIVDIIEPRFSLAVFDPEEALHTALTHPYGARPLRETAPRNGKVGIILNDMTRATPNTLLVKSILKHLDHINRSNIILFIALGTHRKMTDAEVRVALGDDLFDAYSVVQNDCLRPETQILLGQTQRGNDIWINRQLAECDLKVLTGFIEPHFFAGFSGGGKAVMPGMAGQDTIMRNHAASMIGHPKATWGITHGNPIWEEIREAAHMAGNTFLVNVALNKNKDISAVFCGDLDAAHEAGCKHVRSTAMVAVERPYDIVVTSNSGYPLDQNLYQAVKGMSAAAQIVRDGGAILIAAECSDGIPEHGLYGTLLRQAASPRQLLDSIAQPGFLKQDQWQAQIQALIQLRVEIYVYSHLLSAAQISACLLKPAISPADTLQQLMRQYGADARVCILPEGPQTIAYISAPAQLDHTKRRMGM